MIYTSRRHYTSPARPTPCLASGLAAAALLLAAGGLAAAKAVAAPAAESASPADLYTLQLPIAAPPAPSDFKMGTSRRPDGRVLTADSRSLLLDGRPWMPVMGEFHFARYPAAEWRGELLKMKAGGIDIVSTYVFWIHHEEIQGTWDWSGQRDLHQFLEAARDAGLSVIVRCGPWCHGEVRNGGIPEWAVQRTDWKLRSTDPKFLEAVRALYSQIAAQARGELWKDGGPVVGIQVDNEFRGPAEYLLALKKIAREAGLDVPLYTRTGWPELTTPMPAGEILPLYGVYAEGFWDREVTAMPGNYWQGFRFAGLRTDAAIATEMLGRREAKDASDVANYPYLTCEIGGGMMSSYHRRILVDPRDIRATTLVKIGSGSTLPGYYMYHGGINPDGKQTTLMEAQDTLSTNYNDLPVKNYDFQAPLGAFGQERPSYHQQRELHLFLRDFGDRLAVMPTTLPAVRPHGATDRTTLRWAVRSDGRSGYIFINNYERLAPQPPKTGVQFRLEPAGARPLLVPAAPVTIAADSTFFWPFNFDLGGAMLTYATAQPICAVDGEDGVRTIFFGATSDGAAEFALAPRVKILNATGRVTFEEFGTLVRDVPAGRGAAITLETADHARRQIVLLSAADALALWKAPWAGRDRVFLTPAGMVVDQGHVRLTSEAAGAVTFGVVPALAKVAADGKVARSVPDGVFQKYILSLPELPVSDVGVASLRAAGPAREIHSAATKQGVPQAPGDADFAAAAAWKITLPKNVASTPGARLRFSYIGDVARVRLNGRLLLDDFYNGNPLELGLARFEPEIANGSLELEVLPLRRDAPIYLAASARPDFGSQPSLATLAHVELVRPRTVVLDGN